KACVTQMFGQGWHIVGQAGEEKAPIALKAGNRCEAMLVALEPGWVAPFGLVGNVQVLAAAGVRPAVIAAHMHLAVAAALIAHHHAAVATGVEQAMQFALAIACNQYRLPADMGGEEIVFGA